MQEDKFKDLYCHYYYKLKSFADFYLRDNQASSSVVQDVFIHIYQHMDKYQIGEKLVPYLYIATKNKCLNHLRSIKTQNRYKTDKEYNFRIDTACNLLSDYNYGSFDYKRISDIYKKTLNELPQSVRDTFLLSRNSEMTYKEIAVKEKISIKTVEYRISYALKRLRQALQSFM